MDGRYEPSSDVVRIRRTARIRCLKTSHDRRKVPVVKLKRLRNACAGAGFDRADASHRGDGGDLQQDTAEIRDSSELGEG